MKGILLAGGAGSRLYPTTRVLSKHLHPIHDKPLVYYSLSTLMFGGIRDILIITTADDLPLFQRLLGDGSDLGLNLTYLAQARPEGIAQALILAADFIGSGPVTLMLGDNVFYGHRFGDIVKEAIAHNDGATVFGYWVRDPSAFGVAELDAEGRVIGLEEKPAVPRSHQAVTGLYIYDHHVVDIARSLKPSARGELEITDVNRAYLEAGRLRLVRLGRGIAWLDTGTHEAMQSASEFVAAVQGRQGYRIACLEEVAYRLGFIDAAQLRVLTARCGDSDYGRYLQLILESEGVA